MKTAHPSNRPRHRWMRWVAAFVVLCGTAFASAAFYYSTLLPDSLRLTLTGVFPVLVLCAVFLIKTRLRKNLSLAFLFGGFLVWYCTDAPRNDRDWAGEYAIPADAILQGRIAHIKHVRNFTYTTPDTYTPQYYDADYNLDDLTSLDLITSYWAGDAIAHVFLSFGFRDGKHLAISIETRRQKRFPYSAIAGFFHHYELFYVTADERDLIGVRTDIRKERVYLYQVALSDAARERLFLSYLAEIHTLARQPAWYNTLTDNCTTGILARAQARFRYRFDWRVLLSGYTASLAYDLGLLKSDDMDFKTLKQHSRIQRPPTALPEEKYSQDIRKALLP
ncbi:DUF4105 domain-containing protein [Acetobacter indonesiensis]|uniref:Lnb N-terminal periplasmic domain-containing protein n=1 Tax=Acetobacter indonesiensis TaxID=104101 RepID=UPI0039ECDC87